MKMEQMTSTILIVLLMGTLAFTISGLPRSTAAEDSPSIEELDAIGTYFELPHLNVYVATNATVHILLRAFSCEMISYHIEDASGALCTQITFGYLKPCTIYYMYEDSLVNETAFTTDDVGAYTYTQDLSMLHQVFIQPVCSTEVIDRDTTLQSDIYGDVAIIASNIVFDLNGHSIFATETYWIGIDVVRRSNVTIKNGCLRHHGIGIYMGYCTNVTVRNMTISSSWLDDIEMSTAWNSSIVENTLNTRYYSLTCGWGSKGNKIYHNNFIGYDVAWGGNANTWDDGYPSGGNYRSRVMQADLYNGPNQDILGSDGIGDSPYVFNPDNIDHYPLMNPWTPMETVVKIGGINEPVTIVSNTTIGQIVATKNTLKLNSSGLAGHGYINLIFPMVNTTNIKVTIDNQKPASPFPIISTNGTHYFIYVEFALSTHIVTIQFAPITATVDIDPDVLNLKSDGEVITGYIEFTEEYDVNDITVSTVMLNGTFPAALKPSEVGDHDGNGVPDLMVKFNRTEVSRYIRDVQNIQYGFVTLAIRGELNNGMAFEGSDTITVIMPGNVVGGHAYLS